MIDIQEVFLFSVASLNQHKAVTKFLMSRSLLLVGFYSNTFIFSELDAQFDESTASVGEPLQHDTSASNETVHQLRPAAAAAIPGQRHVLFTSCATVTHQPAVRREPSQPAAARDTARGRRWRRVLPA